MFSDNQDVLEHRSRCKTAMIKMYWNIAHDNITWYILHSIDYLSLFITVEQILERSPN